MTPATTLRATLQATTRHLLDPGTGLLALRAGLLAEGGGWDALVVRSQTRVDAALFAPREPEILYCLALEYAPEPR